MKTVIIKTVALTEEEKKEMIALTIMALNDGGDEALQEASEIRNRALESRDSELIEKINFLWEVI